jgi:hypothetical protein
MNRENLTAASPSKPTTAILILPYFGTFGPWFPLYLQSLGKQRTLDLLLLTDAHPPPLPSNVRVIPFTFRELRDLANQKLPMPVLLHRMRNICDLRPAYGLIFEEFTRGYEYWAFGDEDVLYGDLDSMLAPQLDGVADLVSPGVNGKSGHLTVIRNHRRMNELALADPAYAEVLASPEHWAYDETSWRRGGEASSFHKIVCDAEARGDITIRRGLPRVVNVPSYGRWYVYDRRHLREDNGKELLYYHWGRMRHRTVRWPTAQEGAGGFAFDRYGFYDPALPDAGLLWRRAVGRTHEAIGDVRRKLSDARATLRRVEAVPALKMFFGGGGGRSGGLNPMGRRHQWFARIGVE